MYKIDNKYQKAKIKNLEQRLDFQKYNIKEKKKRTKRKKTQANKTNKQTTTKKKTKPQELLKNTDNNHTKTTYGVYLKKNRLFFFEK